MKANSWSEEIAMEEAMDWIAEQGELEAMRREDCRNDPEVEYPFDTDDIDWEDIPEDWEVAD